MADFNSAVESIQRFSAIHQMKTEWRIAYLGDGNGNVYTSQANYYLVRYPLTTSPAVEIYGGNALFAPVDGVRVVIGYTIYQPNKYQIIGTADGRLDIAGAVDGAIVTSTSSGLGYSNVPPHSVNQAYLGPDPVYVNWRQITPLGVFPLDNASMNVTVAQGYIPRPGGAIFVPQQTLDLTSHIPVSGARYVLISYDPTGAAVVTDGTVNAGGFSALTAADIPATPAGNWRSAAVVLYAGQTAVVETRTEIDFYDLRFPEETTAGTVSPSAIPLTSAHIIVGNASNVGASVAMSNDATISNTGALTLKNTGPGVVTVGDATHVAQTTLDAQGRVTALSSIAIVAGHAIQDEGVALPTQPNLNFTGTGVEAVNDATNSATKVTIDAVYSIYSEIQTGTGGATYYLANIATAGTVRAFVNGIRQPSDDTDSDSDVVTFTTAPSAGATLIFDYEAAIT